MTTQPESPENKGSNPPDKNCMTVTVNYKDSDGVLLCRWIDREGIAIKFPREKLTENINKFPEFGYNTFRDKACLYILLNRKDTGNTAYVGESVNIKKRLTSQASNKKKEWSDVIVFCRNDQTFDKGHILHIEEHLFLEAKGIANFKILNDGQNLRVAPYCTIDPAYEKAADDFIKSVRLVCGMLGYDLFKIKMTQEPVCNEIAGKCEEAATESGTEPTEDGTMPAE